MTKPASLDLGVTGNCIISALVDREARIVWSCLPRLDGDPVFHALIDDSSAAAARGFWSIELGGFERSEQEYVANTAVLITRLYSSNGSAIEVIDFCPRFERLGRMFRPQTLVRRVRTLAGTPRICVRLRPVFRLRLAPAGNHPRQQPHPLREPRSRAAPDDRRAGELRAVGNAVPARELGRTSCWARTKRSPTAPSRRRGPSRRRRKRTGGSGRAGSRSRRSGRTR